MKKSYFVLLVVLFIAIIMMITCPEKIAHKEKISEQFNAVLTNELKSSFENGNNVLGIAIGSAVGSKYIDVLIEQNLVVDNYLVMSVGKITLDGTTYNITIGLFNHVYMLNNIDDILGISDPVDFENKRKEREVTIVQRLKDIRSAQILFKQEYNRYTSDFDSLINYVKKGEIPIINLKPDPKDMTYTKVIYDTVGYKKVMDSLFGNRKDFDINSLSIVPFSKGEKFELRAGYIKRGVLKVPVFEVKTPYKVYLWDLNQQRVNNLRAEMEDIDKYPGLKVGSMDEPSLSGNWETL